MIEWDVIDTGIGMSAEQRQALFQPFTQADNSTARKFGGTGLGLTICKRLAELLGGDVWILASQPKAGTTCRLHAATGPLEGVRLLQTPDNLSTQDEPSALRAMVLNLPVGCRILLAEDGPDNQRLIAFVLRKAGAEVTVAGDGQQAVDLAHAATDRPYDVILMDMQMPVMDGYAATAALRRGGYTGSIIALTAHAMSGDREKCLAAGCTDYATKPIDRQRLVAQIARQIPVTAD